MVSFFSPNKYLFLGLFLYSIYIIGSFVANVSGFSFLPVLVIFLGIIFFYDKNVLVSYKSIFIYLTFLLFVVFSFLLSEKLNYSNYKLQMLVLKFSSLFFVPFFLIKNFKETLTGIFYSLLIFIFISLFFSISDFGNTNINSRLEFGIFNPIWISRAIFECLLIGLIFLNLKKIWLFVLFSLCIFISFTSGSKGPIFSFLITFLFYYYKSHSVNKFKFFLIFSFISLSFYFLIFQLIDKSSYIYQRFLVAVPEGSSKLIFEESRVVVWPKTLMLIFQQNAFPFFFGNGLGEFGTFYFGYPISFRFYPHNLFLELFVEFGFIFFLLVLFFSLKIIFKSDSKFKYFFVYFLLNSMFSGDLLLNEYLFFYLGFIVADEGMKVNNNKVNLFYSSTM